MKFLIVTLTLSIYPTVLSAQDSDQDAEAFINAAKLEKLQANAMVEIMVKSGRFTKDHGDKARREIASIHEDNLEEIKNETIVHIKANDLANK